jgi:hypothetical protein
VIPAFRPIIYLAVAGDTRPCAATKWVVVSAAVAAAKDTIENDAGDHRKEGNENDALQRHSVLLTSRITPCGSVLIPGATLEVDDNR